MEKCGLDWDYHSNFNTSSRCFYYRAISKDGEVDSVCNGTKVNKYCRGTTSTAPMVAIGLEV